MTVPHEFATGVFVIGTYSLETSNADTLSNCFTLLVQAKPTQDLEMPCHSDTDTQGVVKRWECDGLCPRPNVAVL